jgi:hypothetical protein
LLNNGSKSSRMPNAPPIAPMGVLFGKRKVVDMGCSVSVVSF